MLRLSMMLLKMAGSVALAAAPRAPVAVIESMTGELPGIHFMDYLDPGQVIRLTPRDTIVVGYMRTCWQETITGGTVTVGTEQSEVLGGRVERSRTHCDGGRMLLTSEHDDVSAGSSFRAPPKSPPGRPQPEFTLYGRSPIIEVKPNGTLVVERLDQPGERHEIKLAADRLTQSAFIDLAQAGIVLAPGGVYRATAGEREMVFQIDPDAAVGDRPIIGRLVRLQPAG